MDICLDPRLFLGLNTNIKQNVYCISEDELLYPVGGVLVLHNFKEKRQRYIKLSNPDNVITIMTVSVKKKCVAVAERGEKPRIYVYDIETTKKIKTLGVPFEVNATEFMCLTFTHDDVHIAALTGGPEYIMYYYNWQSGKVESQAKANNPPSTPGPVTDMAVNPKDATIVVFVGAGLFRLVSMSENVWRQYGFQKAQSMSITTVCWLTDDRVLAGCKDGRVMIVQSGDLNGIYDIDEINEITVVVSQQSKKEQVKSINRTLSRQFSKKQIREKQERMSDIRCCTTISKGFVFSLKAGEIILFEKVGKNGYKKSRKFIIIPDVFGKEADNELLYHINHICTDLKGSKLFCSTNRCQIYWADLDNLTSEVQEFKAFEECLHHGHVSSLSTCSWKPIFMTCGGFDNSVRLWNYKHGILLLNQTFTETVHCLSLHPTGLYAVIGFCDKVRFFLVLINELEAYREYNVRGCQILSFSNNGHLFAAECNFDILVYSSITFNQICCFKGHIQQITALQWSRNDLLLYSCSINGALYEWSIEQNSRINDVVMPSTSINDLITYKNQIVCIAGDGCIKEIDKAKVVFNLKLEDKCADYLDALCILPDEKHVLLAGINGTVILMKYPVIEQQPEYKYFLMHNKEIKQMCVIDNGNSLITCSKDGSICIWDLNPGLRQDSENNFEQILININELDMKNRNMEHLTCRIRELESEHNFETKRLENNHELQLQELEESYASTIKDLKTKIKSLEKEHSMESNKIHLNITQMKQLHTSQLDQLDSSFNNKLLYEFQKFDTLKDEMEAMKFTYERKIQDLENTMQVEAEKQKMETTEIVSQLESQILQLRLNLTEEREKYETNEKDLKTTLDTEINNLKKHYNNVIDDEKVKCEEFKTELGITRKKLVMLQKNQENVQMQKLELEKEVKQLKTKHIDLSQKLESVKQELLHRDRCVNDDKKYITELRKKNQEIIKQKMELETHLHNLNTDLRTYEEQLVSKSDEIKMLMKRMRKEENEKIMQESQTLMLKGKLKGMETIIQNEKLEKIKLKQRIARLCADLSLLCETDQNLQKLKQHLKQNDPKLYVYFFQFSQFDQLCKKRIVWQNKYNKKVCS